MSESIDAAKHGGPGEVTLGELLAAQDLQSLSGVSGVVEPAHEETND